MRRPSRLRPLSAVLLTPLLLLACIPDGGTDGPDTDAGTGADGGLQADGGTTTDGGATSDAGGGDLPQFARDMLESHNAARASAQPAPSPALNALTWDPTVEEVARKWADNCDFSHNPNRGNAGENIAAATPNYWDAKGAVKGWVDEVKDYDYSKNACASGKQCGHYTQVVWRNTSRLGCATKRCTTNSPFGGSGAWDFWVCNYAPPGNYVGQRPY
jgi:pathogenesis-related protein 1